MQRGHVVQALVPDTMNAEKLIGLRSGLEGGGFTAFPSDTKIVDHALSRNCPGFLGDPLMPQFMLIAGGAATFDATF
jgi:hypothetical protein